MRTTICFLDSARSRASRCRIGRAITKSPHVQPKGPTERPRLRAELKPSSQRIEAFSDGVFAVAVTIIVLEVRVPDSLAFANDAVTFQQFVTLLAIYTLTFAVVRILWANHHYLIFTLPTIDRA